MNWEFGKEDPQNFWLERATIGERQGVSENKNSVLNPTLAKADAAGNSGSHRKM